MKPSEHLRLVRRTSRRRRTQAQSGLRSPNAHTHTHHHHHHHHHGIVSMCAPHHRRWGRPVHALHHAERPRRQPRVARPIWGVPAAPIIPPAGGKPPPPTASVAVIGEHGADRLGVAAAGSQRARDCIGQRAAGVYIRAGLEAAPPAERCCPHAGCHSTRVTRALACP